MKLKILFVIFIVIKISAFNCWGQNRPKAVNVASEASAPSAIASAYNKVNQVPINHYTGIPQINIPIHNFQQGQLAHSLALNYIGGGVRVSEPAGNAGLGWLLSGGGAITRSVQGLPDDMPGAGWLYIHNTRPSTDQWEHQYDPFTSTYNYVLNHINHLPQYYQDDLDGQFDIFQLSAGGLNAKFYFGKNQQIYVSPRQNISISATFNQQLGIQASTIEGFTVTDESGLQYVFSEREVTTLNNTTQASGSNAHNNSGLYGKPHVTAWYLRFIITPFNEDTIRFEYQNFSSTRNLPFPPSRFDHLGFGGGSATNTPSGQAILQGRRLWQIHFPNQTNVQMVYDGVQRCDANGEHALIEIQVRDTTIRQRFLFNYTYGGQRGTVAYGSSCNNVVGDQRLILRSVRPAGPTTLLTPYEFDYEEGRRLPPLISSAQDHWGFFNGQVQNQTLIPALALSQGWFDGANRQPNLVAAAAYSLKAIKYPTGGITSFDYESNTYFAVAEQEQTTNIESTVLQTQIFSFNKITQNATRFTFELTGSNETFEQYGTSEVCKINVTVQGNHNGQWINGTQISGGNQVLLTPLRGAMHPHIDLMFPPGTNQIRIIPTVQPGSSCFGLHSFNAVVRWNREDPETNPSLSVVGGLRVRRIKEYDGINARPASVREFKYVQEGSNLSSGYIAAIPKYHYNMQFTVNGTRQNYLVRSGMPVNFQHYTQGSTVGYSRVEEVYGTEEQNLGRTIYDFTSYKDFSLPGHLFDFPFVPEQVPDWLLGLPKSILTIDAAGRKKDETTYEYTSYLNNWAASDSNLLAVKLGVSHESQGINGAVLNRHFIQRFYRPVWGWTAMTAQRTIQYLENDTLRDWVEITYDTAHFVPIRTRNVLNKQRNLIQENLTFYPFSYNINTGPIAHMRQNKWLTPISTETWLLENGNRRLIDSEINNYEWVNSRIRLVSKAGLISAEPVLESVIGQFNPTVLNRNTGLQPTMTTINQYDNLGNPLEVLNNITGQPQTVIMGYAGRLPIATVPNARRSEVAYSSFETNETGGWTYTGSTQVQSPRSIMGNRAYNLATGSISRNGLGTPSGQYILSFWSRSGLASVSGANLISSETNPHTNWTFWEYRYTGGNNISITGSAILDELRLYPERTSMQTINYIPVFGEVSSCGADNVVVWKEYDQIGRPVRTLDKDWNVIQAAQFETASTQLVDRNPSWQDSNPLVLECEKVPGTVFNNGNQIKLQFDTNPFSFSFQGTRWLLQSSNSSACPILPQWQPTGVTQCVVQNGARTGEQLRQERDAHPLSLSFNQLRWVSLGINGQCPPIQLKAWIQIRNQHFHNHTWGYQMSGDVFVVITDQDGNPIQAPSLSVNYQKLTNDNGWNFTQNLSVNINNSSEVLIYSGLLTDYSDYGFGTPWITQYTFSTLPGVGYTPW